MQCSSLAPSAILRFSSRAWFRRGLLRSPMPQRAAIVLMLAELEDKLRAADAAPIGLVCEAWPPGAFGDDHRADHLGRLAIEAQRGGIFNGRLVRWYEWQHPRWKWAQASAADLEGDVLLFLTDQAAS